MKPSFLGLKRLFALSLGGLFLSLLSSVPAALPPLGHTEEYQPAQNEFDPLGKAVVPELYEMSAGASAFTVDRAK